MALTATDLSVGRGGVRLLNGINFELKPGSALLLRGPNGIGKTTLLRTLAGLTPPHGGRITARPDTIAYGGHSNGIKAQLTIAENLTFWARMFGHDKIDAALTAFDLSALADRRTAELSAGQKRRTSLARLMVTGRPIWCLDEPTVSLDSDNTHRFAKAVAQHMENGGSAILATHIDIAIEGEVLDLSAHTTKGNPRKSADPFAWEETP